MARYRSNHLKEVAMIRRLLVAAFTVVALLANVPARGAFTTIVNSPPDVIAPGQVFAADTQINLYPGTSAAPGDFISLGGFNAPAENVELNVLGGYAWSVEAWTGSQLNVSAGLVNGANLLGGRGVMSGGQAHTWSLFAQSHLEMSGGVVTQIFTAGSDSAPDPDSAEFIMTGGAVGLLDATGNVIIQGGSIDDMVFRGAGFVELTGGSIGNDFEVGYVVFGAFPDDPTGETVVGRGGRVTVRGGSIGERMVLYKGKTLDYSGGVIGDAIQAREGSQVNIRGSHFFIDGVELTLPASGELLITQRDVALTGLLADGEPFRFDLHSQPGLGDYFSPDATVAIMLIPEPRSVVAAAALMLAFVVKRATPRLEHQLRSA
ncbi:MAG: hypothetical protein C0485_15290 [Pirellula sp.]|nr:hypothetical protein [Pirellula sp.]